MKETRKVHLFNYRSTTQRAKHELYETVVGGWKPVNMYYNDDDTVTLEFERERKETKSEAIKRFRKINEYDFRHGYGTIEDYELKKDVDALLDYLKSLPDDNDSR